MAKNKTDRFYNNNENLPIEYKHDYSAFEIDELKKCKDDIFYFAENYFYIINLDEGRQKIKLYDAQRNAIDKIINNRRTIVCASRQCGKSTLMTVVCLWYAIFTKDFTVAILANKEDIAKEILDRVKLAYEELPNWLKAGVWKFNEENILLSNNSKITISTTSATSLRGKSVNLLFLDEFAHVRPEIADPFFKSIMPTISSSKKSKIVVVSTPSGALGKYYELYSGAEKGKNGWIPVRIHYSQVPGRDEAWKKETFASINYDESTWNQEYEIHFLSDGASAINTETIERLKLMCRRSPYSFDQGDYQIWRQPQPGRIYSIGVDTGEGVGQDYSVATVLDVTDPTDIEQVAVYSNNKMQPYVFAERLNQIIRSWGRPFVCAERNGPGGQVVDALYEVHKYDNIVAYTMKNDKRQAYQKLGIFCHHNSKYTGIMNMKYYVEYLDAVKIYDRSTVKEFETFVRKENKTWGTRKGCNDDRIMSLIWALLLLETDITREYLEIIEVAETGKPLRIHDPNRDIADELLLHGDKSGQYSKQGGAPMPSIFQLGRTEINIREKELDGYLSSGWKVL